MEVKQDIQLILLNPLYRLILSSSAGQLLIGVPIVSVYLVEIVKSPSEIVGYALIARTITSMLIMFIIGSLIRKIGIVKVIRISGIGSVNEETCRKWTGPRISDIRIFNHPVLQP